MKSRIVFLLLSGLALLGAASCSRKTATVDPDIAFSQYVNAYTGGIVTDGATIKVQLASQVSGVEPGTPADGLFSFSPALKGTAVWAAPDRVEFIPEAGALRPGETYRATFKLGKVMKVHDKALAQFPFTFRAGTREAQISLNEVVITADAPSQFAVTGEVRFSEPVEESAVKEMLSVSWPGADTAPVTVSAIDPAHYQFGVSGLQRGTRDQKLGVSIKSDEFRKVEPAEISIPATGAFRILSDRFVDGKDPYIIIQFSEPLAEISDYSGLVGVSGFGRCYARLENNSLKLFYDTREADQVSVTVYDGIKSIDGTRLGTTYTATYGPVEPLPAVEIPIQGNILPDPQNLVLPLRSVNLRAVDVKVIKIYADNMLTFLQDNNLSGDDELRRSGRLIWQRTVRLDTDPSKDLRKWQDFGIDLSGLFKEEKGALYRIRVSFRKEYSLYGQTGPAPASEMIEVAEGRPSESDIAVWDDPYAYYYESYYDWYNYEWDERDNPLTASYYMVSDRFPAVNLMASNIGLNAQYAGGDHLWVSTSDLVSAKPMGGVELEAYNYQLRSVGKGRSGSDGLAELKLSGKPFVLVARHGDTVGYLKLRDGEEKSFSRFDVGGATVENGIKGYLYGERGVWRPGDTLHVSLVVRDKDKTLPENHPAVIELYTPQGQFYSKTLCSNAAGGFYVWHLPTLPDDPTGIWNAYAKVGGSTFHKSLRIESVKPNRLKVNINLGPGPLASGVRAPVLISANWLTGPAAAGLAAKADMTLVPGGNFFKGFEGYNFTDPTVSFSASEKRIVDTRLDGFGKAQMQVEMPAAEGAPGMLTARILCSVEEPGGDASFTTLTMPFSPYKAYVGIKPPKAEGSESWLVTDKDQVFQVAVVDKDGRRVSGQNIEYRVYKMRWSWWWESRASELDSYVNGTGAELVSSGRLVSGNGDLSIPVRVNYPDWGRYLVYVKDLDSGHATGTVALIDWPSYRGQSDKTDPDALTMLTFSTDKKSYKAGETATVYVPAAEGGRALVSLENASSVISRAWVQTKAEGDTPYSFKVTEDMAPNFYVHITLLQPHNNTANDLPIRLYGVQPVFVDNPASRLEPEFEVPDVVHPEETFRVKVHEKSGRPMTYTLAVVDEGLLDLTGFKTPDPWNAMYEREALGVRSFDLFDAVIGAYSGRFSPMLSIGGDQEIVLANKRDNRFNPVVRFYGPFQLAKGTATHDVTLPMYVGSVRVMLVAGEGGAFGSTDKAVTVRSPLMVLPTLPRVLGPQEKVTLPVNVFVMEDGVRDVQVSVQAEGPVRIAGAASTTLNFSAPGDQLARFELETTGEGTAKVTVTAKGGGKTATETVSVPVRNASRPVTAVQRTTVKSGKSGQLNWTPFEAGKDASATLTLTHFPAIDFDAAFSYVKNYQYSCSEQISARGINLVFTKDLLSKANAEEADTMIPALLQELYGRQLADGGFAYWPGRTAADTWVTSMAGVFLNEAAGKGYKVSQSVRNNWKQFQQRAVQNYRKSKSVYLDDLDQAFRLYSLALAGAADAASMNRLKESADLSAQARWMLAAAYAVCGKTSTAKELISVTEKTFEAYPMRDMTFGSSLRDKAIAIEALTLTDDIADAISLAEDVADAFSRLYSTQELAFASIAMSRLAAKSSTDPINAVVRVGKAEAQNVQSAHAVWSGAVEPSAGTLTIEDKASGQVHATLVTVSRPAPGKVVPARSNLLGLKVSYTGVDGKPVQPARLQQGTDFVATIQVTNLNPAADMDNLALCLSIPSGWEIVNERLTGTGASDAVNFDYNDIRDDCSVWYFSLRSAASKTFRVKLRAAYEGSFVLPPVTCEAMYDAEVCANTASGTAEVVR